MEEDDDDDDDDEDDDDDDEVCGSNGGWSGVWQCVVWYKLTDVSDVSLASTVSITKVETEHKGSNCNSCL